MKFKLRITFWFHIFLEFRENAVVDRWTVYEAISPYYFPAFNFGLHIHTNIFRNDVSIVNTANSQCSKRLSTSDGQKHFVLFLECVSSNSWFQLQLPCLIVFMISDARWILFIAVNTANDFTDPAKFLNGYVSDRTVTLSLGFGFRELQPSWCRFCLKSKVSMIIGCSKS